MSQTKNPLVSVLICTHNAEKFIESTLKSVLNQTYSNIEILILDNKSSDETVKIVKGSTYEVKKGPSIRLILGKENVGPYKGLNILLNQARGKYIAINDHDDIWHPKKIKMQVSFLETHDAYIGCGTAIINWYEKYATTVYRARNTNDKIAWHTSLVFRNEGYRYDPSIPIGGDFYFMEKILCNEKDLIYNFEEPMVTRRIFDIHRNLSSEWMNHFSFYDLIKLRLPIIDKLAILNRMLLPSSFIELIIVKFGRNNIPKEYINYINRDY